MNEKYYIKRIRKGDYEALNQFIEILYPQIYQFVYRKIQNETAKDITQEVFIRFFKVLPTYKSKGKVLNYLYRIASHLCLNYWKRTKNYCPLQDELIECKEDINHIINKNIDQEQLLDALKHLKPEMQDVIILKYFEQYTFKEIAETYHLNISTVKTRHYQALIKLKKILERNKNYGSK